MIADAPRPGGARRLGRHVEHDPRSRAFAIVKAPRPLVSRVWTRDVEAFDQGDLGSCTANALLGCLVTEPFRMASSRVASSLTQRDAVAIYSRATKADAIPGCYPPDDTGSSGLAVCKVAKKMGLIRGYLHAFTAHAALHALSERGPIMIGANWYAGMDEPQGADAECFASGELRGGHEWMALGINLPKRLVLCVNSWGPSWGAAGRFSLSFETLERLMGQDGDVTIPLGG